MTQCDCKIKWNILSLPEWEERFSAIPYSTLCQSYEYAQAICPIQHQKARWGLIEINDQEAGLVQILEAGILGNLLHGLHLDRGPLWFDGFGSAVHIKAFFDSFNREFPNRFGRRRRIIPEVLHGAAAMSMLKGSNLTLVNDHGYETIWLDLQSDSAELRENLDKKWRNALSKAERAGLEITCDEAGQGAAAFLMGYSADRAAKGYDGPSVKLSAAIIKAFGAKNRAWICTAQLDKRDIAAILVLCHGSSATYQIGWSSEEGRNTSAHNLLLWHAIQRLKQNGYRYLDLGGVNDESAKGVKKFKEGLGGHARRYAGQYI